MADLDTDYRIILNHEFTTRKAKNSKYSKRAFAKFLSVDNGFLSKLLSGKVMLSLDLAESFCKKLKLDDEQRTKFILSAAEEQKCHALYLLDPSLAECDEDSHETNILPKIKKK